MGTKNKRVPPSSEPLPALRVPSTHASIAILPFVNLTGDAAKDYFADVIAEELIHTLSRAPALFKVPARTSSFAYKGQNIDVRTVARELDVTSVLEGSVRSMNDGVRVTVQLIDGGTGHHVWSRSYDRSFEDPPRLQDELTIEIADALTVGGSNESIGTEKSRTRDLQAYQLFLQAKSLSTLPTETNVRASLDLLADALRRDPSFARGWQAMAVVRGYFCVAMHYSIANALRDAESDARQALTLDPSLSGSRATLAFISACRGNWTQAEGEFQAARALLPEDPELRLCHAIYLAQSVGHLHHAREEAQAACLLSPMGPLFLFNVGLAYLLEGRDADARRLLEQACAHGLPEDAGPVPDVLAHLAWREDRLPDAARYVSNALSTSWRVSGGMEVVRAVFAAFGQSSQRSTAIVLLRDLEQKLRTRGIDEISSKRLITWYALLGALDFAYEAANFALDTLARAGTVGCAWGILWTEEMRAFRDDARFQTFAQRLGLMEYWALYGPPDDCELRDGMLTRVSVSRMTTQEEDRTPLTTEVSPYGNLSDGPVQTEAGDSNERLTIGQRLSGRYRIERELGEGGMGVVYLAADEQVPGEKFAIKVLKEELRPETLTLLRDEVRKTRKLSHPNIVDVHSVNVDGQKVYVLMEYLEGNSLDKLLDEEFGRGMPFSHAWPIVKDVGAALGNAHDHNVIHSDLKPANVFLTNSGRTKLLDFGIARVSRGPLLHARSGPRALTPAYASCEMLEGKEADRRDDIYSFACVIYEMLCGERPFVELGALEAREAGTKVPGLQVLSREQNAALAKALAFGREERTSSVEGLIEGLVEPKPRGRQPVLLAVVSIIAVAALAFAWLALDKLWISRRSVAVQSARPEVQMASSGGVGTTVAFNPPPHSVAVLPFHNMSDDASQQYFSDGLSEDLITALSQFAGLKVIGRTSAFQFRDSKVDSRSIGAKLGVAHLLEGSVRRSGAVVRVSAELIDTADGSMQWSERYDRPYKDLFALQDEITRAVAVALSAQLLPGDHASAQTERPPGGNLEAYNAFLRGRFYFSRNTEADYRKAIESYTQATQLDPLYAIAWSGLSETWSQLSAEFLGRPAAQEGYETARAAADRALTLAPDLAAAHLARGFVLQLADLDWRGAEAEYRHALALAPNDAEVKFFLGFQLATLGEVVPATELTRQALATDPLRALWYAWFATYLVGLNRLDEAEQMVRRAMELQPSAAGYQMTLTIIQVQRGQAQAALASAQRESPGYFRDDALALARQIGVDRSAADAALRALIDKNATGLVAYQVAQVYALRNDAKATFAWLDRAWSSRDPSIVFLLYDPFILRFKDDPRFAAFCRKVGLPVPGEPPRG
jgi:TolB-like protein/Tfp pilus assembly protein PilF